MGESILCTSHNSVKNKSTFDTIKYNICSPVVNQNWRNSIPRFTPDIFNTCEIPPLEELMKESKELVINAVENSLFNMGSCMIFNYRPDDGTLFVNDEYFPYNFIEFIRRFPSIKKLKIVDYKEYHAEDLVKCIEEGHLSQLEKLNIIYSPYNWKDEDDWDEILKKIKDNCPKLYSLKIRPYSLFIKLGNIFPNLIKTNVIIYGQEPEALEWIKYRNITNLTVSICHDYLPNNGDMENIYLYLAEIVNFGLQSLTFDNSCMFIKNGVSHTNLELVARECPKLKYFKTRAGICKHTRKMDNLYLALDVWSELEHLDFTLSDTLKYVVGAAQAVSKMKKLRTLKINIDGRMINSTSYRNHHAASFIHYLKELPALRELHIGNYFSMREMRMICKYLSRHRIEILSLSFPIATMSKYCGKKLDITCLLNIPDSVRKLKLMIWGTHRTAISCDPYIESREVIFELLQHGNIYNLEMCLHSQEREYEEFYRQINEFAREHNIILTLYWNNAVIM